MSSSAFLDIPDSFESVMDENNRLPLGYLPADWLVLICTNPSTGEYGFTKGESLHRNWESGRHHRFYAAKSIPPNAIQVACPDGTILAIKISSYGVDKKRKN
jgi:hypothetical protein